MGIFIIFIVFFIACIFISAISDDRCWFAAGAISGGLALISGLVCLIMVIVAISNHTNVEALLNATNAERDIIEYQIENKTYLNDNNIGAHEVFEDVERFNSSVFLGRGGMNNPWTKWLYKPIWDDIEPISLE